MTQTFPAVSVAYARNGSSTKANALGMRPMQERVYERRGEQYLLIKSPPASGKSRALMFIALDKLHNQGLQQAIIVVPEKSIGSSFNDEPLSQYGFWVDWQVEPQWNLCNAPGSDNGGKVKSVGTFLECEDKVLVCTHATFRFAVDQFGVAAFDDRLIAVDEFHHVSANPDNKLGAHLGQFIARDKVHIVAMTGSYFRGDAEAVLVPQDESKFDTVTYTYYEQLNGYEYLKQLDIGYFFYSGSYADDILKVLNPAEKTIVHIPNVNSRESTKDKIREVEHIIEALGEWQGIDPMTGFQLVKLPDGRVLRIADLVEDDSAKRDKVSSALKDPAQKNNRDHVDIIIALGMAKEGFDWIWCEHALTVGYRSSLTEIVQIIGRATRDAPEKVRARFTNLIAEPDDDLLAELGVETELEVASGSAGITKLRHVRSSGEKRAADEIANREKCEDFDHFKPLFSQVESELKAGIRLTRPFGKDASVEEGNFFILGGQLVYVATKGEDFQTPNGHLDARLRVIYANGTESNLLLRSLQRALYKDEAGRRLTNPDAGPIFSDTFENNDIESGTIYVLRSQSSHPFVAEHRVLIHKIGVTGGKVETRIANAAYDATYLLADVEVIATYKLAGINRTKLENLFHRIFAPAQLDLVIHDRFGNPVRPKEWFLVPLHVIDESVQRIRDGSITAVVYNPQKAKLVERLDTV